MGLENKSKISVVPYSKNYREAIRDLNLEWIKNYFKVEQADRDALDNPEGYILLDCIKNWGLRKSLYAQLLISVVIFKWN